MVHEEHTEKVIDGLNLVFVELPKFKPHTVMEKRMAVLWLRFLTEIDEDTREVPRELLENPEVSQALDIVEQSAYDEVEMYQYDKFWDAVRVEQGFIDEAEIRYGMGREDERMANAHSLLDNGVPMELIAKNLKLTEEEQRQLADEA